MLYGIASSKKMRASSTESEFIGKQLTREGEPTPNQPIFKATSDGLDCETFA